MRPLVLFLSMAAVPAGCCPPAARPVAPSCVRGRAFIVVRHAEKESSEPRAAVASGSLESRTSDKDTPLSEAGRMRAKALAEMLANTNVTRLVASQYKRTQETLAPLAERTSLQVEVRPAGERDKTNDLIAELRAVPDGAVVVIATHSNVVPLVVRELGGGGGASSKLRGVDGDALPDDDFARVYVIAQPCGASSAYVMELSSPGAPMSSPTENH